MVKEYLKSKKTLIEKKIVILENIYNGLNYSKSNIYYRTSTIEMYSDLEKKLLKELKRKQILVIVFSTRYGKYFDFTYEVDLNEFAQFLEDEKQHLIKINNVLNHIENNTTLNRSELQYYLNIKNRLQLE